MKKKAIKTFTSSNGRDIVKLKKILGKNWIPGVAYIDGDQTKYVITMDNDFILPSGEIFKQQHLEGYYTRENRLPISESTLGLLYTWDDVKFSQVTREEKRGDLMSWTFAQGLQFDYFKVFPGNVFETEDVDSQSSFSTSLGRWYDSLIATKSVDLLYMLTYDIITFEEMNSTLWYYAGRMKRFGESTDIEMLSHSRMHLNFAGCNYDRSFFKNGQFQARFLGIANPADRVGAIYEFRSCGNLNVEAQNENGNVQQKGESFFSGRIILDLETGDLLIAEMIELLTVMIKNNKDKLIPLQKRRLVQLSKQLN